MQKEEVKNQRFRDATLLEEVSNKARNRSDCELGKGVNIHPWSLQKKCRSSNALILACETYFDFS